MSLNNLLTKARSGYEAFNRHDFDAMASMFSDRFEYLDLALNRRVQGPDDFKKYCQELLTAFPDAKIEIKNMVGSSEYIVTEYVLVGTHQGQVTSHALGRQIPPTHRRIEVPVCEVIRYEDGKVTSIHGYSDAMTLIRQLGLESQLGQLAA